MRDGSTRQPLLEHVCTYLCKYRSVILPRSIGLLFFSDEGIDIIEKRYWMWKYAMILL